MKNSPLLFLIVFLCMLVFANRTAAQNKQATTNITDPNREFVLKYLKSFDNYINNPDSFDVNQKLGLQFFKNRKAKTVYNFLSQEKKIKGNTTPEDLYGHIRALYKDGLGIVYNPDSVSLVTIKKHLLSKTNVYKTTVECSGIRNDGNLVRYKGDLYYNVKSSRFKSSTETAITRISNKRYFKRKFKNSLFREGLFIEPTISLSLDRQLADGYSDGYQRTEEVQYEYYTQTESSGFYRQESRGERWLERNYGINLIYMVKPYLGFGTGISSFNTSLMTSTEYSNDFSFPEIMGYIPTLQADVKNDIQIKAISTPVFVRLQFGLPKISISFDYGAGLLHKPQFDSYLSGSAEYYGVSTADGTIDDNNPTLGFMDYSFDNELVHQHRAIKNIPYLFGRANLHLQFTKYFYTRLSINFTWITDIDYNESWHMFDGFATGILSDPMAKKSMELLQAEFAIGININELF